LSTIWQSKASEVEILTNARPTVGDIPRDSATAQIICWSQMPPNIEVVVVAPLVFGLVVLTLAGTGLDGTPV
jgi:hypothetical protein